jgi:hypothetical protein
MINVKTTFNIIYNELLLWQKQNCKLIMPYAKA